MGLERQLNIARVARQEAEFDVRRARQRVTELNRAVQEAAFDLGRAHRGAARARVLAGIGWVLALVAGTALLVPRWQLHVQLAQDRTVRENQALLRPVDPDAGGPELRPGQGERVGTVLVQDLAVRLTPTAEGEVRAFLNRGTRVVLERQIRLGPESWLLIRSVSGAGWVRGSDVLH